MCINFVDFAVSRLPTKINPQRLAISKSDNPSAFNGFVEFSTFSYSSRLPLLIVSSTSNILVKKELL